jgi:hypothetical protein
MGLPLGSFWGLRIKFSKYPYEILQVQILLLFTIKRLENNTIMGWACWEKMGIRSKFVLRCRSES